MRTITRRIVSFFLSLSFLLLPLSRLSAAILNFRPKPDVRALSGDDGKPFILKQLLDLKDKILVLHSSHRSHSSHASHSSHRSSSGGGFVAPAPVIPREVRPVITESAMEAGVVSVTISVLPGFRIVFTTDGTVPSLKNGTVVSSGATLNITSTTTIKAAAIGFDNVIHPVVTKIVRVGN